MTHHTPIWLLFSSGEGPAECALAVAKLWVHFQSKAQLAGFHAELVEYQKGPQPQTFESVLVAINGPNLETFVNPWLGTIQWQCASPYRPKHKRKNWFVSITKVAAPAGVCEGIDPRDITWKTAKASGPGGQHTNKTETAVLAIHRPSGLRVSAQEARSQIQNKKIAMKKLEALLNGINQIHQTTITTHRWQSHYQLQRGQPIKRFKGEAFVEQ